VGAPRPCKQRRQHALRPGTIGKEPQGHDDAGDGKPTPMSDVTAIEYSVTRGRFGLRHPTAERWGMLRLRTVGRRSGEERTAILGYIEGGSNLVTRAMNGWAIHNTQLDAYAAHRSRETAVVILEPRTAAQPRGNRSVGPVV